MNVMLGIIGKYGCVFMICNFLLTQLALKMNKGIFSGIANLNGHN